jgi:hypothetical protein
MHNACSHACVRAPSLVRRAAPSDSKGYSRVPGHSVPSGTYAPTYLLQVKLADELEVQVLERRARPTGQPSSGAAVPYARTFGATYGYCGIQRKLQCLLSAYGAVGPLRAPGEEGTTRAWRSGGNKGSALSLCRALRASGGSKENGTRTERMRSDVLRCRGGCPFSGYTRRRRSQWNGASASAGERLN